MSSRGVHTQQCAPTHRRAPGSSGAVAPTPFLRECSPESQSRTYLLLGLDQWEGGDPPETQEDSATSKRRYS